jgi:hypothetical protein
VRLNEINDDSLLNELFSQEIVVFEDVQGSKIFVNWNGKEFIIKPKSLSSEPINLIDLAMQNYYNHAINYFNSLDSRVKGLLNKKWWFCFEYFPDNQPANIQYDRVPKNHLVLTSISKNGRFEYSFDELDEYARLFNTDVIPVIFKGKLSEKSIEAIKYFLNTSEDDLEFVFGEKSFSFFFYKLLNPQLNNSFLMQDDFQKNIEKIIIRVSNKDISFEILNPLYKRISNSNSTDFVEIYSLILVNFLNFCQSIKLDEIKIKANRRDEAYINLICKLFNIYLSEVKEDLLQFDFAVPEFFDKDKFRINKELIQNKKTKSLIEESPKIEYIFKVILGSFNKKRKKTIGVFTEDTLVIFNTFVDRINSYLDKHLKKLSEIELTRKKLLDFGDFFEIKYDTDGDEQVYPDIYTEFEKGFPEEKNKKKSKGGKFEVEPPSEEKTTIPDETGKG